MHVDQYGIVDLDDHPALHPPCPEGRVHAEHSDQADIGACTLNGRVHGDAQRLGLQVLVGILHGLAHPPAPPEGVDNVALLLRLLVAGGDEGPDARIEVQPALNRRRSLILVHVHRGGQLVRSHAVEDAEADRLAELALPTLLVDLVHWNPVEQLDGLGV